MKLELVIKSLPTDPGIYKYLDKDDVVIYVGKAKNIKKRVNSYFVKQHESNKTRILVSKIYRIEFVVVDSEMEALLLENNLIKTHQPKYNILLKDDKSFPLIRLSNERFPRVFAIRNPKFDGSTFYGPYTSARAMHGILDLIKSIYPLRNCNFNLSEENIIYGKFKACLEYQLGNCKAPCIGLQQEDNYNESIAHVKNILNGNLASVKQHLKEAMLKASDELRFEEAASYKQKIDDLELFRNKSTVVNHKITDVDVFSIISDDSKAFVNFLKVNNGMIVQTKSVEYKLRIDESQADVLSHAVPNLRKLFKSTSKEIIVPVPIELFEPLRCTVPKSGDKKKLLDLSLKNVLMYRKQKLDHYEQLNPDYRRQRLMEQMKSDLRLTVEPRHIECFDNSNIQGTNPVSACVVFKDGKPSKKEYRHFNIKTVIGPNDFDSMKEVVERRYTRVLNEGGSLPNLIVIDGGKGQLSSVVGSLKELGIFGKVAVIGIAKRLEEIYFPGDTTPMYIDKKSESLKVIQHLRDEAHRFGITHHRNRRSKSTLKSSLLDIPGVGDKTLDVLLKAFKSVKKIKEAKPSELAGVIGAKKADIVVNFLKEQHDT
ncbi:MAG: excinuclease ABC subunit C [Bacteroidia bacterium]